MALARGQLAPQRPGRCPSTASRSWPGSRTWPRPTETTMGYPVEYGGRGDLGGYIAAFETLALRRPVAAGQVRRAVRPVRRRGPAPRHRAPPRALPARHRDARAARLLRDDRDRATARTCRSCAPPRPTTRTAQEFVIHTPDDVRAQGLHRQRGPRRADGRRVRQLDRRRRGARRARAARADPRRRRRAAARRADRGLRPQARPQRRRQRPASGSTTCASRARTCSTATPTCRPRARYTSPIENPTKRFFTMLGTLIQGRVSVCGAAISATKVRADDRRPPRATRGASSGRPDARRRCR